MAGYIYSNPLDNPDGTRFKAKKAKKKVEEATGKKGRELAKKVANVGKPKDTAFTGYKKVRKYGSDYSKPDYEPNYTKVYSPKQEAKIKMTQRQMKLERQRTATRAVAKAKQVSKKKK
jgi:hypothetical protein